MIHDVTDRYAGRAFGIAGAPGQAKPPNRVGRGLKAVWRFTWRLLVVVGAILAVLVYVVLSIARDDKSEARER
jgi:hypothetical protein